MEEIATQSSATMPQAQSGGDAPAQESLHDASHVPALEFSAAKAGGHHTGGDRSQGHSSGAFKDGEFGLRRDQAAGHPAVGGQFSDGADVTQAAIAGVSGTSDAHASGLPQTGGGKADGAKDSAHPPAQGALVVKFNKQLRTLSPEEAKAFAQKGMKYDRVAPMLSQLSYLGSRQGKTAAELVASLLEADEAALREALAEQAGGDAERLEELLAAEREKHGFSKSGADGGAAEPAGGDLPGEGSAPGAGSGAQPEPLLARLAREFVELKAACPEVGAVADLPDAVLADAAKTGRNLLDSLLRYRWNEARKAEAAAKSRQAAAGRSTGSLSAPAESPVQAAAEAMVRGVWS